MKKLATTLTAIALLSSGIGVALTATPSAAASIYGSIADCSSPGDKDSKWNFDKMKGELWELGIEYESVDKFGNCFIVRAVNPDGTTTNMFFDPLTLNRVK